MLFLLDNTEPDRDLRLDQAELAFQQGHETEALKLLQEATFSYQCWTAAEDKALRRYTTAGQNF